MIVVVRTRKQIENADPNLDRRVRVAAFEPRDKIIGETTLGKIVELTDVEVSTNPNFLRYDASNYLAWELTPECNAACRTCYNWSNTFSVTGENYVSVDFAVDFADSLGDNPYIGRQREIILSGGEPTIMMDRLVTIVNTFTGLGGNNHVVITSNGLSLPMNEEELSRVFERLNVTWQISYNRALKRQYELHRGEMDEQYQVPDTENPALDKLELLRKVGKEVGITIAARVMRGTNDSKGMLEEVQERIGPMGVYVCKTLNLGSASRYQDASSPILHDAKNREEMMHISSEGIIYPSVHNYGSNSQIGTILRVQ